MIMFFFALFYVNVSVFVYSMCFKLKARGPNLVFIDVLSGPKCNNLNAK